MDVVINLAALIGIPYSYRAPKSYFDTNAMGLLNILNSALNSNIKKLFTLQLVKFTDLKSIFQLMKNI